MTGETLDLPADRAPAKRNLVRDSKNSARKAPLQSHNRTLQAGALLVTGSQVLDTHYGSTRHKHYTGSIWLGRQGKAVALIPHMCDTSRCFG
jgi:hypothetical protein